MSTVTCERGHAAIVAGPAPATCPGFVHGEPCPAKVRKASKATGEALRAGIAPR